MMMRRVTATWYCKSEDAEKVVSALELAFENCGADCVWRPRLTTVEAVAPSVGVTDPLDKEATMAYKMLML